MTKHNKFLKETKARVTHECSHCGETIHTGEEYYKETLNDRFLHSLHARSFCTNCYKLLGEKLLEKKGKKKLTENEKSGKLSNFI